MIWLLFLDTTDTNTAIHLVNDGFEKYSYTCDDAASQASIINVGIEQVLDAANINLAQVNGIVVNAGPGSYTGLRVALSCAKGLCFALDIPLIAHNKLQLIVNDFMNGATISKVLIAMKARADEYFVAAYNHNLEILIAPCHQQQSELAIIKEARQWDKIIVVGDEHLWVENAESITLPYFINIENWMKAGFASFQNKEFEDIAYFEPLYLKAVYTTQSKKKLI